MTPISLVCPYFEDPRRLFDFIWNENVFKYFDELIIVDDGSYEHPAKPIVADLVADYPQYRDRIRLFRVPIDYGFNAHGARNLAMRFVRNQWCALIDVDNRLTKEFCENLHESIKTCPEDSFLVFNADIAPYKDTLNHFALRKEQFWFCCGYDEEMMGFHYGDRIFRHRLDGVYNPIMMDPPYLIFERPMHEYEFRKDCVKVEYRPDGTMIHPPDQLRSVWERYLLERNDNRSRWWQIEASHGKFLWYEEDLESHQLELDLGELPKKLKHNITIWNNPHSHLLMKELAQKGEPEDHGNCDMIEGMQR